MAGIITHIAVADAIANSLGDRIKNVPLFFSGNIAPDSIHSRENFVREMKRHTHLKDDIHDRNFLEPENQNLFHKRIDSFIKHYCKKGEEYDLYCGYVTHLLTDELFIKTIRLRFVKSMEKLNINQSDKAFFLKISAELNNIDNRLSQEYPFKHNPKDTLWCVDGYEIKDYLSAQELSNSKGWLTWNWFDNKQSFTASEYISYEGILDFIDYASKEIVEKLKDYKLY